MVRKETVGAKLNYEFTSSQYQDKRSVNSNSGDLNGCLLVVLLIVFWPAGIVYLIYKLANKK